MPSLVIREIQVRSQHTSIHRRMAEMKKQTIASADTAVEQLKLYTMGGSTNWKNHLGKAFGNIYHAECILTI